MLAEFGRGLSPAALRTFGWQCTKTVSLYLMHINVYIYIYTGNLHDLELIGTLVIVISVVYNGCWILSRIGHGCLCANWDVGRTLPPEFQISTGTHCRWGTNPYYNNSLDDLKQSLKLDEKYIKVRVPDASNPAAWSWTLGAFGSYQELRNVMFEDVCRYSWHWISSAHDLKCSVRHGQERIYVQDWEQIEIVWVRACNPSRSRASCLHIISLYSHMLYTDCGLCWS